MMLPVRRIAATIEPVGGVEIGDRLGVKASTVGAWQARYKHGQCEHPFPRPRWTVGGLSAWDWAEVEAWARVTGRLQIVAA